MNLRSAIIISLAMHVGLVAWLAILARPADVPLGDGIVTVEVIGEAGDFSPPPAGSTPSPGGRGLGRGGMPTRSSPLPSPPPKGEGNASATPGNLGSGQAQSIAGSPGGNPILTKIVTRINRSKYYPEAARRDKIEGRPEVLFQIGPDGSISLVELKRSSGNKLLDDAALETVRRAAPLPYYEAPISVAINYILD